MNFKFALIVVSLVTRTKCDDEGIEMSNTSDFMQNIPMEQLLRGSNVDRYAEDALTPDQADLRQDQDSKVNDFPFKKNKSFTINSKQTLQHNVTSIKTVTTPSIQEDYTTDASVTLPTADEKDFLNFEPGKEFENKVLMHENMEEESSDLEEESAENKTNSKLISSEAPKARTDKKKINTKELVTVTETYSTEVSNIYKHGITSKTNDEHLYKSDSTNNMLSSDIKEQNASAAVSTPSQEAFRHSSESDPKQRTPKQDTVSPPLDKRLLVARLPPEIRNNASAVFKSWLEDQWLRIPIAVLVPLRPRSLARALAVWKDMADKEELKLTDTYLMGYDVNGIGWVKRYKVSPRVQSATSQAVSSALGKLLVKYQEKTLEERGDAVMQACVWAAKRVPYDSALFIITDSPPSDGDKLRAALRALIEKRLKVYVIWTDPNYPSELSKQNLNDLIKIAEHTEGEVLPYALNKKEQLESRNSTDGKLKAAKIAAEVSRAQSMTMTTEPQEVKTNGEQTLVIRKGGGGPLALGIPVEEGVKVLRVYVEGSIERASLYPPNGPQIDLLNETSVMNFSSKSQILSSNPLSVMLLFPHTLTSLHGPTKPEEQKPSTAGVWHLSVRCTDCNYHIIVSALAKIGFNAEVSGKDTVQLRVSGPVATVRETTLYEETGTDLYRLPFSYQPSAGETGRIGVTRGTGEDLPSLVTDVPLPSSVLTASKGNLYVKIVGKDIYGQSFVRISGPVIWAAQARRARQAVNSVSFPEDKDYQVLSRALTNQTVINAAPRTYANIQGTSWSSSVLITVEVGLTTRLYGRPGDTLQQTFIVTSYLPTRTRFNFKAESPDRILQGITPSSKDMLPTESTGVIVGILIPSRLAVGTVSTITFTSASPERLQIQTLLYVVDTLPVDVTPPTLYHTIEGSCLGKTGSDCYRHTWSANVFARDTGTGILRLSATQRGFSYVGNFTAGTRDEVVGSYRETCCSTLLQVQAWDALGNTNAVTIDVSWYLSPSEIAAIALAVFLLIAIIVILIGICYIVYRRSKESRNLPSYATRRDT